MKTIKLDKRTTINIPSIPNFIKCGDSVEAIQYFTSEELRKIGKAWTDELVVKARQKRIHIIKN